MRLEHDSRGHPSRKTPASTGNRWHIFTESGLPGRRHPGDLPACGAVNYHFGQKEQLYQDGLAYAEQRTQRHYPFEIKTELPPEEHMRAFIHSFLVTILDGCAEPITREACRGKRGLESGPPGDVPVYMLEMLRGSI